MEKQLKIPTQEQANAMKKLFLSTSFEDGGYVAKCTVDGKEISTKPNPLPYAAIKHLMNVISERKKANGEIRGLDFQFYIPQP